MKKYKYDFDEIKQEFKELYFKDKESSYFQEAFKEEIGKEGFIKEITFYMFEKARACEDDKAQWLLNIEELIDLYFEGSISGLMNDEFITECPQCQEQVLRSEMVDVEDAEFVDLANDVYICQKCVDELSENAAEFRAGIKADKDYQAKKDGV